MSCASVHGVVLDTFMARGLQNHVQQPHVLHELTQRMDAAFSFSSGCSFDPPRNPEAWWRCQNSKLDLKRLLPSLVAQLVVQRCDIRQLSQLSVAVLTPPTLHHEEVIDTHVCSMDVGHGPACRQNGLQLGQEDIISGFFFLR